MKNFLKNILQRILRFESKLILKKYKPKIVGITGSVGKTSTKEAIGCILGSKYNIRMSLGSYNNEIGTPLTIIGEKTAGKSFFGWVGILLKGLFLPIFRDKNFPEILVLELGISGPGDMDYFIDFIKPDVVCVTAISDIPVHLKYFNNIDELVMEKFKLVECLTPNDKVILNYDNRMAKKAKQYTKAEPLTFGFNERADVSADNLVRGSNKIIFGQKTPYGLSYKLHYIQKVIPVRMPYILGRQQVYSSLCAATVGIVFNMNLVEISQSLVDYKSPPGRMNLIEGIKHTYIIDDTYNASPDSGIAALEIFSELEPDGKKIAILGDMLELGPKTEEGHRLVGKKAGKDCDILVTVGSAAKFISDEAKKQGMEESKIYEFEEDKAIRAAKFVQNKILKEGDLVLIKGSQGIRLEKSTKELMAEPQKAGQILVRQSKEWKK